MLAHKLTVYLLIAAPIITLVIITTLVVMMRYKRKKNLQSKKHAKHQSDDPSSTQLSSASWRVRLHDALKHSSQQLSVKIQNILHQSATWSEESQNQIRKVLYNADLGVETCDTLLKHINHIAKQSSSPMQINHILSHLAEKMIAIIENNQTTETLPHTKPRVVMMVGVNGVGKTTTTGKLASRFVADQQKVLLCAADTFRAGAIDQLRIWGDRIGVDVIHQKSGTDPAAVAYTAVQASLSRNIDTLIIDTAGRLQNKANLMNQLQKIYRVIKKLIPDAPHEIWIVIDSTTGSNALSQVRVFRDTIPITGLIITKLDGTAKGGAVVGLSHSENIPIRYIGIGETAEDLRPFHTKDFVHGLLSLPDNVQKT